MCGSMADIQSAMTEIRRGKKKIDRKKKKPQGKNMMACVSSPSLKIVTNTTLLTEISTLLRKHKFAFLCDIETVHFFCAKKPKPVLG